MELEERVRRLSEIDTLIRTYRHLIGQGSDFGSPLGIAQTIITHEWFVGWQALDAQNKAVKAEETP